MNGSKIGSMRDFGSSFKHIKILWISRCRLPDLSGILAFPDLEELYASYNQITQIFDLSYCEKIEIIDLEGNKISDFEENLGYLQFCDKLETLTLSENDFSQKGEIQKVKEILPQVKFYNDIDLSASTLEESKSESPIVKSVQSYEHRFDDYLEKYKSLGYFNDSDISEVFTQTNTEQDDQSYKDNISSSKWFEKELSIRTMQSRPQTSKPRGKGDLFNKTKTR